MGLLAKAFPGWAASRATARLTLQRAELAQGNLDKLSGELSKTRAYEAAAFSRRTDGWVALGSGPNQEIAAFLSTLRGRSRDLVRNNPWATKAVKVLVGSIVRTGIHPHARVIADEGISDVQKRALEFWDDWANTTECHDEGSLTFAGIQAQAVRSTVEAGEVLARFRRRRLSDGLTVPLQIQLLEPDHLDSSKDETLFQRASSKPAGRVMQGVEFDLLGRRAGYWLYPEHPGEVITLAQSRTSSVRIPARDIIHHFDVLRIGQVRGIPWGVSAFIRLRDADHYEDAQLFRQRIAACFVGFTQSLEATDSIDLPEAGDGSSTSNEKFEPGTWRDLPPGREIRFANPPTVEGFEPYMRTTLRGISAAYGTTYEEMTNDLTQVNFHSGRLGRLQVQAERDQYRALMLVPQFLDRVWTEFLQTAELAGLLRPPARVGWTPPRTEFTDPSREAKAEREDIAGGLQSISGAIRRRGGDPETVFNQLAQDLERLRELGITPNLVGAGAAAPPSQSSQGSDGGSSDDPDDAPED